MMHKGPGTSALPGIGVGMHVGSLHVVPPSPEVAHISSFGLSPQALSDQNGSPGSSIGVRDPKKNSVPSGARLTDPKMECVSCRWGQINPCSSHVAPPSREREIIGLKSLMPKADWTMQEHTISPRAATAARGPLAAAVGVHGFRCVTIPSWRT